MVVGAIKAIQTTLELWLNFNIPAIINGRYHSSVHLFSLNMLYISGLVLNDLEALSPKLLTLPNFPKLPTQTSQRIEG